jgi:hypothetical protein
VLIGLKTEAGMVLGRSFAACRTFMAGRSAGRGVAWVPGTSPADRTGSWTAWSLGWITSWPDGSERVVGDPVASVSSRGPGR